MNPIIDEIYSAKKVVGLSGKVHELNYEIDREEGEFLFDIISSDSGVRNTLEVGCAFGLSSLYICSALIDRTGAFHTIIDPVQNDYFDGAGIKNLNDAGFDFYQLIELKSEFALPQLLQSRAGQFDFVFIDGNHTFDHTLLDCFYATHLLKVGGYLAIDDVKMPAVRRAVDFIKSYPCYKVYGTVERKKKLTKKKAIMHRLMSPISQGKWYQLLGKKRYRKIFVNRIERMVALQKVEDDKRDWDWHDDNAFKRPSYAMWG